MAKVIVCSLICLLSNLVHAQFSNKVLDLEGVWAYRSGSGYEQWIVAGDTIYGTTYRVNLFGDTLVSEEFKVIVVERSLHLTATSYNFQGDDLVVKQRFFSGKKRKPTFHALQADVVQTIIYKQPFLARNKMYLLVKIRGTRKKVKRLVLLRAH